MTQETSGDLSAFMRRHTEMRIPSLPTHCMSGDYQALHPRTWPFPGIPSRYFQLHDESDPNALRAGYWPPDTTAPTIPRGISRVTRQRHADYDKHHEGGHRFLFDLIREARNQALDLLDERGPVHLERYIKDKTLRLRDLASAIDEEFLVVKSRSRKEIEHSLDQIRKYPNLERMFDLSREKRTTRVIEARRFLQVLQGSLHHRPGAVLQDILPHRTITGEDQWRLGAIPFRSVSKEASYTKQSGFDFLKPLTRPRTTKCVSIPAWGYEFGLSHLPLDITLDQAELIAELCFIDLKNRADRICGSHALIYFRTVMEDVVLQEFDLYGKAERWNRERVKEGFREASGAKMGRPMHAVDDKTMEDRRLPLVNALRIRDHWHTSGPHRGKPKWKTITSYVAVNFPDLFIDPKRYGMPLTPKRIADVVRDNLGIDLDSIREELEIPDP